MDIKEYNKNKRICPKCDHRHLNDTVCIECGCGKVIKISFWRKIFNWIKKWIQKKKTKMNVKNAVMRVIAWMTSTQMCTVFVLVILVSAMILKIKGKSVCHVNSGIIQKKLCIDPRDSLRTFWNVYGR